MNSLAATGWPSLPGRVAARCSSMSIPRRNSPRRLAGWRKLDHVPVDDDLAGILEVDGDAMADHRLDLADAPVGPARMAHEVAGSEKGIARLVEQVSVTSGYDNDSRPVTASEASLVPSLAYNAGIVIHGGANELDPHRHRRCARRRSCRA